MAQKSAGVVVRNSAEGVRNSPTAAELLLAAGVCRAIVAPPVVLLAMDDLGVLAEVCCDGTQMRLCVDPAVPQPALIASLLRTLTGVRAEPVRRGRPIDNGPVLARLVERRLEAGAASINAAVAAVAEGIEGFSAGDAKRIKRAFHHHRTDDRSSR